MEELLKELISEVKRLNEGLTTEEVFMSTMEFCEKTGYGRDFVYKLRKHPDFPVINNKIAYREATKWIVQNRFMF